MGAHSVSLLLTLEPLDRRLFSSLSRFLSLLSVCVRFHFSLLRIHTVQLLCSVLLEK